MGIYDDWTELMFSLNCLQKGSAKRQFRHAIRYSWGGMCAYCSRERATTVDHIKPRCRGGSDLRSNLIPCCLSCNKSKGSLEFLPWFEAQEFYNDVALELINEWIANKRNDYDEYYEQPDDRAEVCLDTGRIRSSAYEPTCA